MSIGIYRQNLERLNRQITDIGKQIAKLNEEIGKLRTESNQIRNSITKNTTPTLRQSKEKQILAKDKSITDKLKQISTLEGRRNSKLSELNRNTTNLEKSEKTERQRQSTAEKKHQAEELRLAKEVTAELEQQSRLHSQMSQSPLVIDLTRLPEKIKVLFLAANPVDQKPVRLDEEIRAIQDKIRLSEYRESVELISRWAVRPEDLIQILNEHQPHVIQFSGHGYEGGIAFSGGTEGKTKIVTNDAIVQLIKVSLDNIRLVIFNTCLSSVQAAAVAQHIDLAIGMSENIRDDAARVFIAQFYSSIGFGLSVQQAFEQGKAALMLEGIPQEHVPEIYHRDDVDPSQIILVRP